MSDLFKLRRSSTANRLAGLRQELDDWNALTVREDRWHRHQTQIARLSGVLGGLLESVDGDLAGLADDAPGWRGLAAIERRILAANGIWDLFRAKLVLRSHAEFGPSLRLADDFAWACYAPVQAACAADKAPRAPPLAYFSETWSPFAIGRNSDFSRELRIGDGEVAAAMQDGPFVEALARLPVPLISIPWFLVGHLPGMLIIAHEIGHVVSWDFALGKAFATRIDAADFGDRTATWQRWREEVFADLFGILVAGGDFAAVLIDLLAAAPETIAGEKSLKLAYPPRALRAEIALRAVARTDPQRAARLRGVWEAAYPERPEFPELNGDIDAIVAIVGTLNCKRTPDCKGTPLAGLFSSNADAPLDLADRAVRGTALGRRVFDPVPALAAAQRIHEGAWPKLVKGKQPQHLYANLRNFVDQAVTDFRGSPDPDTPLTGALPDDHALGGRLAQIVDSGAFPL